MVSTSVRDAWGGRLLLFAALLFGIVTMHTLGHPSGEHGGYEPGSAGMGTGTSLSTGATLAAPNTATPDTTAPHTTAPHTTHTAPGASPHTAAGTAASDAPSLSSPQSPLHGMDPMSVCLAVLAAWGVVLLGARLLTSRPFAWAAPPGGAALLRALRPRPPPRKAVLARLSVLRI
ncbi:hypothetical protein ACH4SP_16335 [Streptomyces sp. NPDC021093]|uniref:hypothetical protein n=1 Tax=Streptomyces sp. NPDC021093 TaxID=3365112 RepID=UPI0037937637